MNTVFSSKVWLDLFHEDTFWSLVSTLTIVLTSLLALLYSDRIAQWRASRQERAKWFHWNRG
jgi:hypothetical protein